jgi:hypothetical protein
VPRAVSTRARPATALPPQASRSDDSCGGSASAAASQRSSSRRASTRAWSRLPAASRWAIVGIARPAARAHRSRPASPPSVGRSAKSSAAASVLPFGCRQPGQQRCRRRRRLIVDWRQVGSPSQSTSSAASAADCRGIGDHLQAACASRRTGSHPGRSGSASRVGQAISRWHRCSKSSRAPPAKPVRRASRPTAVHRAPPGRTARAAAACAWRQRPNSAERRRPRAATGNRRSTDVTCGRVETISAATISRRPTSVPDCRNPVPPPRSRKEPRKQY